MEAARTLGVDHIWIGIVDLHGIDRGKYVPIAAAEDFLENGLSIAIDAFGSSPRYKIIEHPEVSGLPIFFK